MNTMEIRHAIHPDHARIFDTEALRREFLLSGLFQPGEARLAYTYYDRLMVGALCPTDPLDLEADPKLLGGGTFLERREMGIINIGPSGKVSVDGREYALNQWDGLYVGRGAQKIRFLSDSRQSPARFYFNCAPAHQSLPTEKIEASSLQPARLGSAAAANSREIRKYIHPQGVKSCQLVMGLTRLAPGSVWNTMPCHTHVRRIEAYLYLDLPADGMVFHLMGEPGETRHLVVRNQEAVLSPSWSIHSGVGTCAYSFIWGMVGENQTFDDMDAVEAARLR